MDDGLASSVSRAVLVTGCSSGIGWATAERLARRGWAVYATARNVEEISPLAERGCRLLSLDVTDEDSMRGAVEEVERIEGAVGVLINNAGYSQSGAVEEVPMDKVRRQFETNVFGLVRMCQLVLPGMREQGFGRIVNLSSMGGRLTFPGGGFYHASKHAVEAISDALRFEVRGFGVEVVVVEPGLIRTGFARTAASSIGGGERSLRRLRRRGSAGHARELREGTAGGVGGRPRGGRRDDRACDIRCPPAGPLHGDPFGEGPDLSPEAPAGQGLGQPRGPLLPPPRRVVSIF